MVGSIFVQHFYKPMKFSRNTEFKLLVELRCLILTACVQFRAIFSQLPYAIMRSGVTDSAPHDTVSIIAWVGCFSYLNKLRFYRDVGWISKIASIHCTRVACIIISIEEISSTKATIKKCIRKMHSPAICGYFALFDTQARLMTCLRTNLLSFRVISVEKI